MTVYIDDMKAPFGRMVMSHMIADTSEELKAMAKKIGVNPKWIQNAGRPDEHFDIAQSMKAKAITAGAVPITLTQCGCMIMVRKVHGKLCKPRNARAEAAQAMKDWRKKKDE